MAIGATMIEPVRWMSLPLALIGMGLVGSFVGISSIEILKKLNPAAALRYATYIAGLVFVAGAFFLTRSILGELGPFWAALAGIVAGLLIGA
jgi:K(+)-stimulated pyrophosphate-energized sodium pump